MGMHPGMASTYQIPGHPITSHGEVKFSPPMEIPMPAHKQVIRTAVDRQVMIPQPPETKIVN